MHLIVARRTTYKTNGVTNTVFGFWGHPIVYVELLNTRKKRNTYSHAIRMYIKVLQLDKFGIKILSPWIFGYKDLLKDNLLVYLISSSPSNAQKFIWSSGF